MVARVYACKRVHTVPAAFFEPKLAAFFEPNLSLFCGFCEDTTEGRTKKVKRLQRCFFLSFLGNKQALSFQGLHVMEDVQVLLWVSI